MTEAQVKALVVDMIGCWPHSRYGDERIARLTRDLEHAEPALAKLAMEALYRDGVQHAPSGADLLRKLAELLLDTPDWGMVKAAVLAPRPAIEAWVCPQGECDGSGWVVDEGQRTAGHCACFPVRQASRRRENTILSHPIVAGFLADVGSSELADVEADRTAEAQVRTKYEAYCRDVTREVTYRGLGDALPQLRRLAERSESRKSPRPLDAVAALSAGTKEAPADTGASGKGHTTDRAGRR